MLRLPRLLATHENQYQQNPGNIRDMHLELQLVFYSHSKGKNERKKDAEGFVPDVF
ncbi:MAG: hypothetical protein HQ508_07810 [Candidatus Marinimicrobia bacterium]|nr:hypothetical protein [Candidatus Neomarinimicrobiota bacterium]